MHLARRRPLHHRCLVALACATLALGAAAQGGQGSQFYEDALKRFEKEDYAGTIVQLKNALKADGKNLSALVLLGKALQKNGEVNAAEVAFSDALRLGVSRAEVVTPLARAVIAQGKSDQVLSDPRFETADLAPAARYELLLVRAAAATDVADPKAALRIETEARSIKPEDPGSYLAEVPVRIRSRELKEALTAADRAVALAPGDAETHYARGESLHVVPDLKAAMVSYEKTLALDPRHLGALIARAGVHLDFGRLDAAAADVATALKAYPRETRALYLKAIIAQRQGRAADARVAFNEVTALIDVIPSGYLRYRPQTQMLGGLAHQALGQREKAKPYLEGVLRSQPGHSVAKVLADLLLTERAFDAAIDTLDRYLRQHPRDPQAVLLLASAHMAQGRHARAAQIAQDALKSGDEPQLRTALGLSLIGSGRVPEAIRELEAVFSRDKANLRAGYALGSLYLQSNQASQAVRVAQTLARTHPGDASVQSLLGGALRAKGDAAGARAAYQAAVTASPGSVPALLGLARLEMDARNWAPAAAHLNEAHAKDTTNVETALQLAELSENTGRHDDAQRWLQRADEAAGADNFGPALALVDFHLRQGQVAQAQQAIKRAVAKAPDAVLTLIAAARVQLAAGDQTSARSLLTRASNASSQSPPQLTRIAGLQLQAGAPEAAAYSLDKALGARADYLPALALRAEVDIRLKELTQAEQRIKRLQSLQPRSGVGHTLAGDLATARQQTDAAIAAYRRSHELEGSSASFIRLFAATLRRDRAAGIRLAEQWVASRPTDVLVWRALGDSQFAAGNLAAARRSYEALLKLAPRESDTMNNLAHVLLLQKDGSALKMAEQALALSPEAPHIIGTAGWAAFKAGQHDRAIQLLRDARLRDPANPDTRYFLASVLAAMGRPAEARNELSAALQSGSGLSYRNDAEQLLASLR
jgi:putative PEP-CTERM system TPR-repeat lipoprotein